MKRMNSRRDNNVLFERVMNNVARELKAVLENLTDEELEEMIDEDEPRMPRMPRRRCENCPRTKEELKAMVEDRIRMEGEDCDLNDIDVSDVQDFSEIFFGTNFRGDISEWNTSNATDMNHMFMGCEYFNCDISRWDVSNVRDMECMFYGCKRFNQDLRRWDTGSVICNRYCFEQCGLSPRFKPMFPAVNETRIFPHRGMKSINESRRMGRRAVNRIGYRRY